MVIPVSNMITHGFRGGSETTTVSTPEVVELLRQMQLVGTPVSLVRTPRPALLRGSASAALVDDESHHLS